MLSAIAKRLYSPGLKNIEIEVQNYGKELYSPMDFTLKCIVIDLGTLEVLVSHSEKHIFNKPLSILPERCSGIFLP